MKNLILFRSFLLLVTACIPLIASAQDGAGGAVAVAMPKLRLGSLMRLADVVVLTRLSVESELSRGEILYRFKDCQVLKGQVADSDLLYTNVNGSSTLGIFPQVEPDKLYMLMLYRPKKENIVFSDDRVDLTKYFWICSGWMGIVALDADAKELRAVESLKKHYGFDLHLAKDVFAEAVKYHFSDARKLKPIPEFDQLIIRLRLQ